MKLANIRILAMNTELDPRLAECVNKLALARPELVFTFDPSGDQHRTYQHPLSSGFIHGTQGGVLYARQVEVTQDGLVVGSLTIERRTGGSGINTHICVTSRTVTINNRRRRSSEQGRTYSSNMATVVRNAKKFFTKPSLSLFVYEKNTSATDNYGYALNRLEQDIDRGRFMGDQAHMQLLLNAYLRGHEPDAVLAASYRAIVMSPPFETALAEYMLAKHMRHHPNGVIPIHVMPNGLYAFFAGSELSMSENDVVTATVELLPFEALPDSWQDRLAVLQLLADKELVIDVGYRLDNSNFLLIR